MRHKLVAWTLSASLSLTPPGMAARAASSAGTAGPLAEQNQAPSPALGSIGFMDGGWPRGYDTPTGGKLVIYQPQVLEWPDQRRISAMAAVSYLARGASIPALGVVRVEADTWVSVTDRLVRFGPFHVTEPRFSTLSREQVRDVVAGVENGIPDEERVIALDRVLAGIDTSQVMPHSIAGVKADPPTVFFSSTAALMVNFDGDPIWSPITGTDLRYAINTNWDVFEQPSTGVYYLRNDNTWLKTTYLKGPWAPAGKLPAAFSKLPADGNWTEVAANLPGRSLKAKDAPSVFVSFLPAELILLAGPPAYQPVPGTRLLWVSNTDADLFRLGTDGPVYYLVAGRWFSAPDFRGPWTFATTNLPGDFARIPVGHERARVLASVPGTPQAAEAVLLAQIPQTARVNARQLKAPAVAYQGDPQFVVIEGTDVARAVNTDKDILKVGDLYYMCFQGVWFMSTRPVGPWAVTSAVPKGIYAIPVSSPAYHVTHVTVEDHSNDWVTFAVVGAYTGIVVSWGCAVWGTGWYYPPYVVRGPIYPVYYPHFHTYGYAAWYNPWTGGYGRSARAYGPYGGAGVTARYNPATGTYVRSAKAWGPYGSASVAHAYNPRTGIYAQARQHDNVYSSWGSTYVQRGDDWARATRFTNKVTGTTTRTLRTDQGAVISRRGTQGGAFVGKTENGDIYAGRDGNVYRRQDGSWQRYGDGSWSAVGAEPLPADAKAGQDRQPRPMPARVSPSTAPTLQQLDRDARSRADGAKRTSDFMKYRSGAGARGSGGGRRVKGQPVGNQVPPANRGRG